MASNVHETPQKRSATTTKRIRRTTIDEMRFPTHDEIQRRAHELYKKSGCQGGRDVEFWLEVTLDTTRWSDSNTPSADSVP